MQTVGELGEDALVARIVQRFGLAGPGEIWAGDDSAVVGSPKEHLLVTADVLVQDVDFRLDGCSGFDVGWKAVAANASDIAAMGGRPRRGVAVLAMPSSTSLAWLDDLVEGLAAACDEVGVELVGGDLSEAREVSVCLTFLGELADGEAIRRSGASPGEALCVTGSLGGARAGLILLERGLAGVRRGARPLIERQLRPTARVGAGIALAEQGVSAMIDVSDGLAVDASRLAAASGVGCSIESRLLPLDATLPLFEEVTGISQLEAAIVGGEDFELLFTVAADRVPAVGAVLTREGTAVTRIGTMTEAGFLLDAKPLEDWRARSWEHLQHR